MSRPWKKAAQKDQVAALKGHCRRLRACLKRAARRREEGRNRAGLEVRERSSATIRVVSQIREKRKPQNIRHPRFFRLAICVGMPEEPEIKSEALKSSIERLLSESRRLREASDRLMREGEELKKLIPDMRQKRNSGE